MKVSRYRDHPLFPFSDFRTNDESFRCLLSFWKQVIIEAIGEDLYQRCESLNAPERDNGPERWYDPIMIDFWIPDMRRGGRVVLLENKDNLPFIEEAQGEERFNAYHPFICYIDYRYMPYPYEPEDFTQMVCRSDVSEAAVKSVQNFFHAFLVDHITEEDAENMIQEDINNTPNYPTEEEWKKYDERRYADDE